MNPDVVEKSVHTRRSTLLSNLTYGRSALFHAFSEVSIIPFRADQFKNKTQKRATISF